MAEYKLDKDRTLYAIELQEEIKQLREDIAMHLAFIRSIKGNKYLPATICLGEYRHRGWEQLTFRSEFFLGTVNRSIKGLEKKLAEKKLEFSLL